MIRFFSPRFQRIAGVFLVLIFQLFVFLFMINHFSNYFIYFYWFCVSLSILVSIWIANSKSKLPYKVAWIIPIAMFPLFGGMMIF